MPAIAYKTFQNLSGNNFFKRISDEIIQMFEKQKDLKKRARVLHDEVNKHIKQDTKEASEKNLITCARGCAACCYSQVAVTEEDISLLAEHIENGLEVDFLRLEIQATAQTDPMRWKNLKYEDRRCVFLNDANECRVYQDRPSVCRTNLVVSHPLLCDTKSGTEKPIRLVNTPKADMAIIGSFMASSETGALAPLLLNKLRK